MAEIDWKAAHHRAMQEANDWGNEGAENLGRAFQAMATLIREWAAHTEAAERCETCLAFVARAKTMETPTPEPMER